MRRAFATPLVVMAVLAGCGGGDEGDGEENASETTESAASTDLRSDFLKQCAAAPDSGGFVIDCGCIADVVAVTAPEADTVDAYLAEMSRLTEQEPGKIIDCVLE